MTFGNEGAEYNIYPIALSLSIIALIAVFLNVLVLIIAYRGRLYRNSPNLLVMSLAVADGLFVTHNLPLVIVIAQLQMDSSHAQSLNFLNDFPYICQINGVLNQVSVTSSMFTVGAMAAERYMRIVKTKPFSMQVVQKIIVISWISSIFIAFFPIIGHSFQYSDTLKTLKPVSRGYVPQPCGTYCMIDWASPEIFDIILKINIFLILNSAAGALTWGFSRIFKEVESTQQGLANFKAAPIPEEQLGVSVENSFTGGKPDASMNSSSSSSYLRWLKSSSYSAVPNRPKSTRRSSIIDRQSEKISSSPLAMLLSKMAPETTAVEEISSEKETISRNNGRESAPPKSIALNAFPNIIHQTMDKSANSSSPGASSASSTLRLMKSSNRSPNSEANSLALDASSATMQEMRKESKSLQTMLLRRSIAIVGSYLVSWISYDLIILWTWIANNQVPRSFDAVGGILASLICIWNPLLSLALDLRFRNGFIALLPIRVRFADQEHGAPAQGIVWKLPNLMKRRRSSFARDIISRKILLTWDPYEDGSEASQRLRKAALVRKSKSFTASGSDAT
jgi:predicted secreted protein